VKGGAERESKERGFNRSRGKQRLLVAVFFLIGFGILFGVLAIQARIEGRSTSQSISELKEASGSDPLGLVQAEGDFEVLGISEGGSTIGYACALKPLEAANRVSGFLVSQGWHLLGDNPADHPTTTLSFSYRRADGSSSFLFVQCIGIPNGTSVVVEVL
jgi:hypothetical protein